MRIRWIALLIGAVVLTAAWWGLSRPAVGPDDVHLVAVLRPPGKGENLLHGMENRWTLEIEVAGRGDNRVSFYADGLTTDSWDFYQGLTFGSRGGSPVSDQGWHIIQDVTCASLAAKAMQAQGVAAPAEVVARTWGFLYTGMKSPARMRFYLDGDRPPNPDQVAVAYTYRETRLGRTHTWTKAVRATLETRTADEEAFTVHGLTPGQVLNRYHFGSGQALLWEHAPGQIAVAASLKQPGGGWESTGRSTIIGVASPLSFRHGADVRPVADQEGKSPLWALFGRVDRPGVASVTVAVEGAEPLRSEVNNGYWLVVHAGPLDVQRAIDLIYFTSRGNLVSADWMYLTPRCRPAELESRPGTVRVKVYFSCDAEPFAEPMPAVRLVPAGEPPLAAALAELLKGPTEAERSIGLGSWFSDQTAGMLRSAVVTPEGRAIVDFSDFSQIIPNASTSNGSRELMLALNGTVFQFPEVKEVEYRFGGDCRVMGDWLQVGECIVARRP